MQDSPTLVVGVELGALLEVLSVEAATDVLVLVLRDPDELTDDEADGLVIEDVDKLVLVEIIVGTLEELDTVEEKELVDAVDDGLDVVPIALDDWLVLLLMLLELLLLGEPEPPPGVAFFLNAEVMNRNAGV